MELLAYGPDDLALLQVLTSVQGGLGTAPRAGARYLGSMGVPPGLPIRPVPLGVAGGGRPPPGARTVLGARVGLGLGAENTSTLVYVKSPLVERSVLATTVNAQCSRVRAMSFASSRLLGPSVALGPVGAVRVARAADMSGMKAAAGDFFFKGGAVGRAAAFAQEAAELFAIVDEVNAVALVGHSVRTGNRSTRRAAWPARDVRPALAWYEEPDGFVVLMA